MSDKPKCLVGDCEWPAKTKGLCGWCLKKFKKGMLDEAGNKIRSVEEKKASIKARLTRDNLKLYQVSDPESLKSFGCSKLQIFIEPASCYRRIFIEGSKKECRNCLVHKDRFDTLERFLYPEPESPA